MWGNMMAYMGNYSWGYMLLCGLMIPPYSSGRRTSVLRPVVTGTDRLLCHTVAE
jgi:hypothetical protein